MPVEPTAVMEVVTHHILAEQKKDDYHDNYKQELSKRGWSRPAGGVLFELVVI